MGRGNDGRKWVRGREEIMRTGGGDEGKRAAER